MNESVRRYPAVILATCCVPWNEDLELDEPSFRAAISVVVRHLTPHVYVFGTAGEGYAVSDAQFQRVVSVFVDEVRSAGGEPCVGVISLSSTTIHDRIADAMQLGVSTFQLALPSWGVLTDQEILAFFGAILPCFPTARFIHYNVPRAGRLLEAAHYRQLAATFENLVGAKHTSGDFAAVEHCIAAAPELQFMPSDRGYLALRDRHECGLIPSAVVANPERARAFFAARGDALRRYGTGIGRVEAALKLLRGSGAHIDGAFDKALVRLHVPSFPLRLLPPYASASDEDFDRFVAAMPGAWLPRAVE